MKSLAHCLAIDVERTPLVDPQAARVPWRFSFPCAMAKQAISLRYIYTIYEQWKTMVTKDLHEAYNDDAGTSHTRPTRIASRWMVHVRRRHNVDRSPTIVTECLNYDSIVNYCTDGWAPLLFAFQEPSASPLLGTLRGCTSGSLFFFPLI